MFGFPYEPYPSQISVMSQLYQGLENGDRMIVESPTGTGKTLCLLCPTLNWYFGHLDSFDIRVSQLSEINNSSINATSCGTDEDWISEFARKRASLEARRQELESASRVLDIEKRVDDQIQIAMKRLMAEQSLKPHKGDKNLCAKNCNTCIDELQDDYTSIRKIYYVTRTHSQINQILKELHKLNKNVSDRLRVVAIGSRKIFCLNRDVNQLPSLQMMNESCRILNDSKNKCPFNQKCADLSFALQSKPHDIEDLISLGRKHQSCSYFASRQASHTCHLIVLPYNIIFNEKLRNSYKIELKDSIIIVDEAHNLCNTLVETQCPSISVQSLLISKIQVNSYLNRYLSRISAQTVKSLRLLVNCLQHLLSAMRSNFDHFDCDEQNSLKCAVDYLMAAQIQPSDVHSILTFVDEYKLSMKLHSIVNECQISDKMISQEWSDRTDVEEPVDDVKAESKGLLGDFLNTLQFMRGLLSLNDGSKFLFTLNGNKSPCSRHALLMVKANPRKSLIKILDFNILRMFHAIEKECYSLILAGGTMKPVIFPSLIEDFTEYLLGHLDLSKIRYVSGGHVVPPKNVLAIVCSGPSQILDFRYEQRNNPVILGGLLQFLSNICQSIPNGFVVFFPCYEYLLKFIKFATDREDLWKAFVSKKPVIIESKKRSTESILNEFALLVKNDKRGATLFAVVGGRLSEGINFADDLGRCVCVIGLPYPNTRTMEGIEQIQYYKNTQGNKASQNFCEVSCWKKVNQSIGRVIRHRNDYAAIILLDFRYTKLDNVKQYVASWIADRITVAESSAQCIGQLKKFFKMHTDSKALE